MPHFRAKLKKNAKRKNTNTGKSQHPIPYKKIVLAFSVFAIVGILAWAFYALYNNSSYFLVEEIIMVGAKADSSVNYDDLDGMMKGKNIFKLDLNNIRNYMLDNYKELLNLRLRRAFPDSVIAIMTLRKPVAELHQNRYYPIDKDGVILSGVKDYPDNKLPIISGVRTNLSRRVGHATDSKRAKKALLLLKKLDSSGILDEHTLVEIDVSSTRNAIFFLEDGLEIKIGREDYALRLENLKRILQGPKLKAADIRYIDLRFKEPVIGPRWKR